MKVLAVLRDPCFSPDAVEKDEAIMMAVVQRLETRGCEVTVVNEANVAAVIKDNVSVDGEANVAVDGGFSPDIVLSMGRYPETLRQLKALGVRVINAPEAVARCKRSTLLTIMQEAGVPVPPQEGAHGYWLKRNDCAGALTPEDVVFAADKVALDAQIEAFRQRGVVDYVVSAHVVGNELKLYGVKAAGFFRYYYSAKDGSRCSFDAQGLQDAAERLAAAVGIEVYGGDCIVKEDGTFCIIDFNDWPSFSRCREEAAEAIVAACDLKNKE